MAQSFFGGTFMFDPEDGNLVAPEDCSSDRGWSAEFFLKLWHVMTINWVKNYIMP